METSLYMKSILNKFDKYLLITNDVGEIVFANDKLINKIKYNKEELYKLNIKDIIVEKDIHKIITLGNIKDAKFDLSFYSKYKESIPVYSDISIDYFENNKLIFIISEDIKYKHYNIEDLEILLDNIDTIAFIKDINEKFIYVNNMFADTYSKNKREIIGTYIHDYFEDDVIMQYRNNDKEVIKLKQAKSYIEKSVIDGVEGLYYIYKCPIYDENGNFKYMICTAKDVTLEETIKEELYKNYNQISSLKKIEDNIDNNINLHELLENIGEKIIDYTGANGLSILLYDEYKQRLYPCIKIKEAIKAFEGIDFIPIKDDKEYQYMQSGIYNGLKLVSKSSIRYVINKNYLNKIKYIGSYNIKFYDEFIGILNISYNDKYIQIHNQDDFMKSICNSIAIIIKNCRLAEEAKVENQKRISAEKEMQFYLDTAVDLVSSIDMDGYFKNINSNWTKLLGWREEELINQNYTKFIHPDDRDNIIKLKEMGFSKQKLVNRYRHKDGSYIWLDWNFKYNKEFGVVIGTAKNITEQVNIENQKKKLEEKVYLESVKNEFFANISHEFKTPLNIILGTTQLVRKKIDNNSLNIENLSKHIDTIKQNSYRLLRLVNNLIDISRIDIGYYNLQPSNYNIVSVVEDITLSVADYIEDKNINLIFDTDTEEVMTSCDPDKIERVILNLLSNAIKYTHDNGNIEVSLKSDTNNVSISVKDSGLGIPQDKLDIIFDRFGQANNLLTRRCEGSGIGLSLVKAIVEMHGGKIKVYSEVGKGTEFIFNIPIKLLDENDKCINNYDNKDFYVEKCNIEFSDIYSL